MPTDLILRLDEALIQKAEAYSRRMGKTVDQWVADYLQCLPARTDENSPKVTPIVRSLRGVLRGASRTAEDYRRHLEEKYLLDLT